MEPFSIKICSDLHINSYFPNYPSVKNLFNTTEPFIADICILVGDITHYELIHFYKKFLKYLSTYFTRIVLVPGNHEYYNNTTNNIKSMKEMDLLASSLTDEIKNLDILNNTYIDIMNIRIYGSILWSFIPDNVPYNKYIPIYNDYKKLITKEEFNMLNYCSKLSLVNCIEQTKKDGKQLIIATHYSPTFDMYTILNDTTLVPSDPLNYFYCNNLNHLINDKNAAVWVFGHTHTFINEIKDGCILLSNPYTKDYVPGLGITIN